RRYLRSLPPRRTSDLLRKHAGAQRADSYERELFKVPAPRIAARHDELRAEAVRLLSIKATLGGIAANVRLELRRAFEHDLPAPRSVEHTPELQSREKL